MVVCLSHCWIGVMTSCATSLLNVSTSLTLAHCVTLPLYGKGCTSGLLVHKAVLIGVGVAYQI